MSDIVERVRTQALTENLRLTRHALEEMIEDTISLRDVLEAIGSAEVLENYREHRRGPLLPAMRENRGGSPSPHCGHDNATGIDYHYRVRTQGPQVGDA